MKSIRLLAVSLAFVFFTGAGDFVPTGLFAQSRRPPTRAGKAKPKPKSALPTGAERSEVEIAPVDPALRDQAIRSAAKIDEIVEAALKKGNVNPNEPTTDEQFVRRAYLDIVGTIPTSKQADSFIRSTNPNKRVNLVDQLLNRAGYGSQMYNWMADMLRLVDRVDGFTYIRPYSDWVKESIRDNAPWNEMVHDMLTAEGQVWDNPAAGFYVRDQGMPLDNLNNSIRMFLGTRIGCAQCHDHPFDRWTQKEFYQLAAFVGGIDYGIRGPQMNKVNAKEVDAAASSPGSERERKEAAQVPGRLPVRRRQAGPGRDTRGAVGKDDRVRRAGESPDRLRGLGDIGRQPALRHHDGQPSLAEGDGTGSHRTARRHEGRHDSIQPGAD
jgi:hypothetical protein